MKQSLQKYNRILVQSHIAHVILSEDTSSIIKNITPPLTENLGGMKEVGVNFTKSRENTFGTFQALKISVLAPPKLFSQN